MKTVRKRERERETERERERERERQTERQRDRETGRRHSRYATCHILLSRYLIRERKTVKQLACVIVLT